MIEHASHMYTHTHTHTHTHTEEDSYRPALLILFCPREAGDINEMMRLRRWT